MVSSCFGADVPAAEQVGAVGRPPPGCGPGFGDVPRSAGLRRRYSPTRRPRQHCGNLSLAALPTLSERGRRLAGRHPEIQHRRMHRADQRHRGIPRASTRNISQIGREDAPTPSQTPPWSTGTPVSGNPASRSRPVSELSSCAHHRRFVCHGSMRSGDQQCSLDIGPNGLDDEVATHAIRCVTISDHRRTEEGCHESRERCRGDPEA